MISVKVKTTPSIAFSTVRYGRARTRNQRPSSVCACRSTGTRVASTCRASAARLVVPEVQGEVPDRPADVGRDQVEHALRRRREPLDRQVAVEEEGRDVRGVEEVPDVVVGVAELLDLPLELLVDRDQLLVEALELLLRGRQLLVRRLELLVRGLHLLVRGLHVLARGLHLLDRALQPLARLPELRLAPVRPGPGGLPAGFRRGGGDRAASLLEDHDHQVAELGRLADRPDEHVDRDRAAVRLEREGLGRHRRVLAEGPVDRVLEPGPEPVPGHREDVERGPAGRRLEEPADPARDVDDVAALVDDHPRRGVVAEEERLEPLGEGLPAGAARPGASWGGSRRRGTAKGWGNAARSPVLR